MFFEILDTYMRLKGDSTTEFRYSMIVKLKKEGKRQVEIAQMTQCSQAWVSKVLTRAKQEQQDTLSIKGKAQGKTPLLSKERFEKLKLLLLEGGLVHDFPTDNWTRERIALLIEKQFQVHYSAAHISKLMKKIGFSLQKPKAKSYKQDPRSIAQWKDQTLPALKKS